MSIRIRLVFLVLLAVVPALILMLYTASEQRRLDTEQALADARRQAIIAAADQSEEIAGARQVLTLLARLPVIRGSDATACDRLLAAALAQYPAYTNLTAIRPDGIVACSAPAAAPGLDLGDRAYFQRAAATRDFAAGDYIIGRISGKPSVDFAHPVVSADGQIELVLALGLDLTWLNAYLTQGNWPPGTVLRLIDQSGTIVASYPEAERIGQSIQYLAEAPALLASRDGVARVTDYKGDVYLIGFASTDVATPAADVHVLLGIAESAALESSNRALQRNLVLLAIAAAFALAGAWLLGDQLVAQPVRQLVAIAGQISSGNLAARTRPPYAGGEIGHLSQAFDDMAEEIQAAYVATVQVLAAAVDARNPSQAGHVGRVADIAIAIAQEYGWPESEIAALRMAAALHDIGQVAVPDAILSKDDDDQSPEEQELLRRHPVAGAHLLQRVPFLRSASAAVLSHHEFYGGGGYPQGIARDEIPLIARIVSVADAFEVIASRESADGARAAETALSDLKRRTPTHFDPAVVDALERVVAQGGVRAPTSHEAETRVASQ